MEIKKREVIASITIISIMMLIGVLISGKISEHQMDKNEKYNKSLKIESSELFKYGMSTNVGNSFVYGEMDAIDTVSYPDIPGSYILLIKKKQRYTMHTRTVTTTVDGKTQTRVETYWTWDTISTERLKSKKVKFLNIEFNTSKFILPSESHIDTIKESSHIRYKYFGVEKELKGTIFADLRNKDIGDKVPFYNNKNIDETVDYVESNFNQILFWLLWIFLIGLTVYGFYYLDNRWLDS